MIKDLNNIINNYLFNICISCNNDLATWNEKIRFRRLRLRFVCHQCRVNKNLQKPKVRQILGI